MGQELQKGKLVDQDAIFNLYYTLMYYISESQWDTNFVNQRAIWILDPIIKEDKTIHKKVQRGAKKFATSAGQLYETMSEAERLVGDSYNEFYKYINKRDDVSKRNRIQKPRAKMNEDINILVTMSISELERSNNNAVVALRQMDSVMSRLPRKERKLKDAIKYLRMSQKILKKSFKSIDKTTKDATKLGQLNETMKRRENYQVDVPLGADALNLFA